MGTLVGAMLLNPVFMVVGLAPGATVGGSSGSLVDIGIDDKFMPDLAKEDIGGSGFAITGYTMQTGLGGRLGGQDTGVEHFEPDPGILGAERAVRPLALQLPEHILAFRDRQMPPLHLGHKQPLAVLRVRRHQVQLDTALPVTLRAGKSRPAEVLEDACRVVMDEFALLLCSISRPKALMRRIHAKPETHGRVGDAVQGFLGGPDALAEGELAGQNGSVQELLQ